MIDGVKLDLAKMQARKDEVVTANVKGVEFLFRKNKITWLKGTGRIAAPGRSTSMAPSTQRRHIVIATGSESVPLPGVTVDEKRIVTSTGALELDKVPGHLVVIGAGVIGLELGSVWRRLGAGSRWWNSSTASCPAWTPRSPPPRGASCRSRG